MRSKDLEIDWDSGLGCYMYNPILNPENPFDIGLGCIMWCIYYDSIEFISQISKSIELMSRIDGT